MRKFSAKKEKRVRRVEGRKGVLDKVKISVKINRKMRRLEYNREYGAGGERTNKKF